MSNRARAAPSASATPPGPGPPRAANAASAPCGGSKPALGLSTWFRRHRRAISLASAAVLVLFGVLLISVELVELTARLARYTGRQI